MEYRKTVRLKDGRECLLREARAEDAEGVIACFLKTHGETEQLSSYPDECTFTPESEGAFLAARAESANAAEILAVVDGKIVGQAGLYPIRNLEKLRHRAGFGLSVEKAYWGLGIGRALTNAALECARRAGFRQVELEVIAGNEAATALYESVGFTEYGRNPLGMRAREAGWQTVALMRLDLEDQA